MKNLFAIVVKLIEKGDKNPCWVKKIR